MMHDYTIPYITGVVHLLSVVQKELRQETIGVALDEYEKYVTFKMRVDHGSKKDKN